MVLGARRRSLNDALLAHTAVANDSPANLPPLPLEQFKLVDASKVWSPTPLGQFATRFDSTHHIEQGIEWNGRIHLTTPGVEPEAALVVYQTIDRRSKPWDGSSQSMQYTTRWPAAW